MANVRDARVPVGVRRVAPVSVADDDPLLKEEIPTFSKLAWRQFRRHKPAVAGCVVFGVLIVATLVGPLVYRMSMTTIDFTATLNTPSFAHPFGTDDLGRD